MIEIVDLTWTTTQPPTSATACWQPILVREGPLPARRLVGDLSDTHKVLLTLHLPGATNAAP
jgi:hypothetical protein